MGTVNLTNYPTLKDCIPELDLKAGKYTARFIRDPEELDEVLRLRYQVFNVELDEGLDDSHASGRDEDTYDASCHHLVVCHRVTGKIVGTYRMQTRDMAEAHKGFYSADEFDFTMLPEEFLDQAVELGRACIDREHRNGRVLYLLWRGSILYMQHRGKRFFFGCSSLASQDPVEAANLLSYLRQKDYMTPGLHIAPMPDYACVAEEDLVDPVDIVVVPELMQLYLNYGARFCGLPAIDRQFKTIDFLTVFDLERIDGQIRKVLLG